MSNQETRIAAMSLGWGNPNGERFVPWLREVKSAGYDGVAGFTDWGLQEFLERPAELRRLLDAEGLSLASADVMINLDNLDHYRLRAEFLAQAGCGIMVCLCGPSDKSDEMFKQLGEHLTQVGQIALSFGVKAVYHNHTGNTGETFEDMDRLLGHIDPESFFVMPDTGHATKDFIHQPSASRATPFLEKYWERIVFIEFKDWNAETDLNTPLGEGLCGWNSVFGLLKDKGYCGWITVEQNGHEGLSKGRTALECARISRQFIKKGLGL